MDILNRQEIPVDAKKIFAGKIFSLYQWKQKLHDGSHETYEMLRRPNSVEVLALTTDHRFIVLDEEQSGVHPFSALPAGMMQAKETPEQTAARELKEESGYTSKDIQPWFSYQPSLKIDWVVHVLVALQCAPGKANPDAGEHIKVRLLTLDELIREITQAHFRHDPEITMRLLQAQLDPLKMQQLKDIMAL